ncbi:AmmeMemoRadiSam system radical SAM enzyme [Fundidesulfovibrio putealis]|uniref:AmmeMemoRadiSam system radical SAM enzyme n=1 Tax=Fundidesulfovibrio putealis TaxID=270496 RepID=UPI0003F80C24|nr:AmmeMemoRadiSam system radical SAM enzyme [Fundidesulfovibrio putealis]
MHPARLWKPLKDNQVQCRLCSHFCVVDPGERGRCGVRVNQNGQLYTLVYDRAAALNIDPIEKKPLYHFLPGTRSLSFGTMGCNLGCSFCQNYTLSQPPRQGKAVQGHPVTPELLVQTALDAGCRSISYTYSEPTVFFELMQDTAKLAKEKGLANVMVSNGFMSPQCLDELAPLIDAANVDLKAFTPQFYEKVCQARLEPVKASLARIRELGWWLEVTTLVIPGLNDSDQELAAMAAFIAEKLGKSTPWHLSRFHPTFELQDRPSTPTSTLERAWTAGKHAGLEYVYLGNVPGDPHNATFCPGCGRQVLSRSGFSVTDMAAGQGACPSCGAAIAGRFA